MLGRTWDSHRVQFANDAHGDAAEAKWKEEMRAKLGKTSEAMGDRFFFAYNRFLVVNSDFLVAIEAFICSCECHPAQVCKELDIEAAKERCPMRGRRVSALCCDTLRETIDSIATVFVTELMPHLVQLTGPDRHAILEEFDFAKTFILAEAMIRWRISPKTNNKYRER